VSAEDLKVRRAEHASLEDYLESVLTRQQRERVLIVSFNQWSIATATVGEIAATLHAMGTSPIIGLWADRTPLHDVGWTTSRALSRLFRSPSRDDRLRKGLERFGLPPGAFVSPPIRHWHPAEPLPQPTAYVRSAIRQVTYRGAGVGRALLQVNPDRNTPVTDEHVWPKRWVDACIRSFAYAYDQTAHVIRDRGATAAVVFNGRFLHDSAVASAAEHAGIPVLSYDAGGNDTDFDLTIDATHDWSALQVRMRRMYEAWEPEDRDRIGGRWFEERLGHVDPRNALFVESQTVGKGLDRTDGQRMVVYFSSSGDEISELDLDWSDYFYGQPGALLALADVCRAMPDTTLIVRTHPHKRMKPTRDVQEWHEAVREAAPDLHLDEHSDVDSYTLMRQADVVVTYGSTTGVEAAYADKPVIVMGPSAYDELGCAVRVSDTRDIERALREAAPGDRAGAIAYGLMMRRRGFTAHYVTVDGNREMLADEPIVEPRALVLKLSDIMNRRARARLLRR
jgi:hypothetical protein